MAEITLKEIAEFRILNSHYKQIDLPEGQIQTINEYLRNVPQKGYNTRLIEEIFKKLGFTYGGTIWVNAKFKVLYHQLTISLGTRELIKYAIPKEIISDLENKELDYPVKIHALLYKYFPGTREVKLSLPTQDFLDNQSYRRNGEEKYSSDLKNFERYFRGRGPFINREKYYKYLQELNLPITYSPEILEKISKEYSNDPLNNPDDINYAQLVELARFFKINKIADNNENKRFSSDPFSIYEKYKDISIYTADSTLIKTFENYSEYYRDRYRKQEDFIRRATQWVSDNFTLDNLSGFFKKIYTFSPAVFGILTLIAFINIIQTTGWNLNFASTLYTPLHDEIFSQILFFTLAGILAMSYFSLCYTAIAKPYNNFLKRVHRTLLLIKPAGLLIKILKIIACFTLIIFALLGTACVAAFNSAWGIALLPIFLIFCGLPAYHLFDPYANIIYLPKKIYILIVIISLIAQSVAIFSDSTSLYAQSCAYKKINNEVYRYRYFETGNWADKFELALLPGSSEKWVDGSNLQIPIKITVSKSDLRSMESCTDRYSNWNEAEKDFKRAETESKSQH